MAVAKRVSETRNVNLGTGIYIGRIISHLDPSYMGALEVVLLRSDGNRVGDMNQTYVVQCAMPFFGNTAFEFMGTNKADYNDTQKSYGMWFVPPDIGVTVLCMFVDGNPADGYWIGCVPGRFVNNMVPGIAGSTSVELSNEDKKKFGTSTFLPVAEVNRKVNDLSTNMVLDKIKKPVHPFADKLLEQGLLDDDVRGTTNSSARRDIPSMVFGISTPGPLDYRDGAKRLKVGTLQRQSPSPVPVSRLGGTQLVFDDGDDQYRRQTPASVGPVKYIDVVNETFADTGAKTKEKGQPDIPYNESVRLRTRTGHQILLHNSEDLIYIGNARGTTWIELTSNGKIDIYAQDSVSIHTENDLNILADRDINLEAGRNINMKAASGRIRQEAAQDWEILVGNDGKISIGGNYETFVEGNTKITTKGNLDLRTDGNQKYTAAGNTDIKTGGQHVESASQIHMNSFPAQTAEQADPIEALPTHQNISTNTAAGWNKKYQSAAVSSIMKRVPMHEPWALHENQAPQLLTPEKTDREV